MPATTAPTVRSWGAAGRTPARTAGLIVVALVHVAMVAALVEGFRRHAAPVPPPLTLVTIEPQQKPLPTPDPLPPLAPPRQTIPAPHLVEIPDIPVESPIVPNLPSVTPSVAPTVPGRTADPIASTASTGQGGTQPTQALSDPVAPGLVCTAMGAPDMPAVNWNGEAVFRAVAEVQGGRVVAVDIRALQGSMDIRTRRAFSNAIDTALKQRYVCPGNHRFQQDFSFRMD